MLFAIAALAIAAPASADWQYSRWGMSPEEVLAANPALRAGEDPENSIAASLVRVSGLHREGGRDFIVRFGFDAANRLNTVYVHPSDPRHCRGMVGAVESRLGRGIRGTQIPNVLDIRTWQDPRAGNQLQLFVIGRMRRPESCSIRYHPPGGPGEPPSTAAKPASEI
jgi:hypothetical protein